MKGRRASPDRLIGLGGRMIAGAALLAMLGVTLHMVTVEAEVGAMRRLSEASPAMVIAAMPEIMATPGRSLSPRGALLRALATGRAATATSDIVSREGWIRSARADLDVADAARPRWGDAMVVRTYIDLLEYGPFGAPTMAHFAQSYRHIPYLDQSALWRLTYARLRWDALDRETQDNVVREAIWYSNRSGKGSRAVDAALGDSEPGYLVQIGRGRYVPSISVRDALSAYPQQL